MPTGGTSRRAQEDTMKKFEVMYSAGESRMNPGKGIDYMLATVEIDGDDIELYAELENPTWNDATESLDDETATYDDLKTAILEQAAEHGIPAEMLKFHYDD
jgi:hypothetical protein